MSLTKVTYSMIEGAPANVLDFGAVGDGVANDTVAVQAAINAADAVYFPTGTYLLDTITLKADSFLFGDGAATIIKQNTITSASYGTFFADSGSSSTTVDNIVIRDMRIESPNIAAPVFSEFQHLVSLNGVKNALVENLHFIGFFGDGLYIGSGATGGQERHNFNVTVKSCFFDGVNKDNRNGISIIDGDGILIDDCYFTRCSRSNMPGAIDIEPDAAIFHIVKNITIRNNKFFDIGGNVAAISFFLPGVAYTVPPEAFIIEGNYIDTCAANGIFFGYSLVGGISESTHDFGILITGNYVKDSVRPLQLVNAKCVTVVDNVFNLSEQPVLIGFSTANDNVIDVKINKNRFVKCGSIGGIGMSVYKSTRVTIVDNEFNDCGTGVAAASNAIDFDSGTSSSVTISNNNFVSPTGKTLVAIQKEAAHTFTPQTNVFSNNRLNGLSNFFDWRYGDVQYSASSPTTGPWEVGQYVYNSAPSAGNAQGFVCTVSGTPGTWKAMAVLF